MKRSNKVVITLVLIALLGLASTNANAGIIVGLTDGNSKTDQCEVTKLDQKQFPTTFDRGIIVGLTGIIVGFTGIIVGYANNVQSCGHLPTGD